MTSGKLATVKRKLRFEFISVCLAIAACFGGCTVVNGTELSDRWKADVSTSDTYRLRSITPNGVRRSEESRRIDALIAFDEACRTMGGEVKTSMIDGTYCIRDKKMIGQFIFRNGVVRNAK